MCKFVLLIAFIFSNPFNFPEWVMLIAWISLVIDIICAAIQTFLLPKI
jgi:hypothetical protein